MYGVEFSTRAGQEYSKLDNTTRYRVDKKIEKLKNNPFPAGSNSKKRLKNFVLADFRIRVDGYRILYDIYQDEEKLLIISIRKKGKRTYRQL